MADALNLTGLDFDTYKNNLKAYLKGQDVLKDYDFEGSNMSVLLDILSVNAFNHAYYTNMAISESFLDTAQLKDSVVSHGKKLNYLPQSRKSSTATINITVTPDDNPSSVVIAKGTEFRSSYSGEVFTFSTDDETVMTDNNDGTFSANSVVIREGRYITDFFQVDTSNPSQKFVLQSDVIDIDSIAVRVKDSDTDTEYTEYTFSNSLLGLTKESQAFFLQGYNDNRYEILFGNDITSKGLSNGNIIEVTYRNSRADEAKGANVFKPSSNIQGYSEIDVSTVGNAQGGGEREGIESIRYSAPRYYQTQDRAVVDNDYINLIKQKFNSVQSVNVFGGDTLTPPQFGKVAIAVDLFDLDGVSDITKTEILDYIKSKSVTTITPVMVDVEFIFFEIVGKVKYDINQTQKSSNDILTLVTQAIDTYNTEEISEFNSRLKYSRLNAVIDDADKSIISSEIDIRPFVKLVSGDLTDSKITKTYQFNNEFEQGIGITAASDYSKYKPVVVSTTFKSGDLECYIEDNGTGVLQLVTTNNSGDRLIVNSNVGSVDYINGSFNLIDLTVSEFLSPSIDIYVTTKNKDFVGIDNRIISVDMPSLTLEVTPTRET